MRFPAIQTDIRHTRTLESVWIAGNRVTGFSRD